MSTLTSASLALLALTLLAPGAVHADGGVFPSLEGIGAETAVEVKAQRAVIWQKPEALEVTIEPIFNWEGDGAWVIPLPALPEVSTADPAFLAELDRATSPVFLHACIDYGCYCGDPWGADVVADTAAGGELRTNEPSTNVTVWASGTVGELDYVVLSVTDGESLTDWAGQNGFAVADEAAAVIGQLEVEGSFFFVARVSPSAERDRALAPVTFRFAADLAPFYPMRFTGSLMPANATIDVTLWVVADDLGFAPKGLAVARPMSLYTYPPCRGEYSDGPTAEEYQADVDAWLAGTTAGGFVVEYQAPLSYAPALDGWACIGGFEDSDSCTELPKLVPGAQGLAAMVAADPHVTRLRGRLAGEGLMADLAFTATPLGTWSEDDGVFNGLYCNITDCAFECHCPTDDASYAAEQMNPEQMSPEQGSSSGCTTGDASPTTGLALLLALAGLALVTRRRTPALRSR